MRMIILKEGKAVNPDKVAFIMAYNNKTIVAFSGEEDDYIESDLPFEVVLKKLNAAK